MPMECKDNQFMWVGSICNCNIKPYIEYRNNFEKQKSADLLRIKC